ncbi:MAG: transcription elongation factor GreA [Mycoplasmatales bacterium]
MRKDEIYLTKEQLEKLETELEYYIHEKRPEVVARIKEAKSFGDLSENSEYDSAREEQAFVEAKIKELENTISNSSLMSDKVKSDVVVLGTTVKFKNLTTKTTHEYKIIGIGSNPLDEKVPSISASTPIAIALSGNKSGDTVIADTPQGEVKLKIESIK